MSVLKPVNICIVGVSGPEAIKGAHGVGKSLICNRFVRPAADDFQLEHCSVLSQTDFGGSPVINNDHWLYWGDRVLTSDDNTTQILVRIAEQTEFLDDETYEPIACSSKSEEYPKRCCRLQLSSRDKLMYIQKEQLGLEADFPQQCLPEGKFNVDGFILVCDTTRSPSTHLNQLNQILSNLSKTKKPVVVAFSKSDEVDEESRRSYHQLLTAKKDVKMIHQPPIEVSAINDVNIEELFHCIVSMCSRNYKHKRKVQSYFEAAHVVEQRNIMIRNGYLNLLSQMMPMNSWPTTHRLGWKRLLSDLDRHRDFINFIHLYGTQAAHRLYDKYMSDAREFWISSRLRLLLPELPKVLRTLFEKIDICDTEWSTAREMICAHALFDDFFQPFGQLGRQLDPMSTSSQHDVRLPAEILMLPDAKRSYDQFRDEMNDQRHREKLDENFEFLLAETPEVTPGSSLADASLFLQGCDAFECLPHQQALDVYDRYQRILVKRAEVEFVECLLEYVDLLTHVVQNSTSSAANEAITIQDLTIIKDFLEQDRRYRWMSKIFDLRDHLIYSMTSFYRLPSTSKCPAGARCTEGIIAHSLDRFFHRREDHAYTHLIDIVIHGDTSLVSQFIAEINCFLQNKPFPCFSGTSAYIRCFSEEEKMDRKTTTMSSNLTDVYLIDSLPTLDHYRIDIQSPRPIPPILVAVCDPSNFDTLPVLHQHAASLAAKSGAAFFGARGDTAFPIDDMASTNIASDCSSLLGRDQLMSICEAVCSSQLTSRKRDFRVQVSMMCGDPYSRDALIANIFGDFSKIANFRPIVHPNLTAGGIVPVDVTLSDHERLRVELAMCSYHSWFAPSAAYKINSTHAHVLVYHVKRPASFEHARTAISRLLDRQDLEFLSPKSIILLAILDPHHQQQQQQQEENDDNQDPLLNGAELCESIGATFLVSSPSGGGVGGANQLTDDLIDFFANIRHMIVTKSTGKDRRKTDNEKGYSSVVEGEEEEHVRPTSLNLSNMTTKKTTIINPRTAAAATTSNTSTLTNMNITNNNNNHMNSMTTTLFSCKNKMSQSDHKLRKKKSGESPARPSALKSRMSRSGPILLPPYSSMNPEIQIAPLATPEAVEIAPEYSLVKDAITSDEGLYETLDFSSGGVLDKKGRRQQQQQLLDLPGSSMIQHQHATPPSRRPIRDSRRTARSGACVSASPDPHRLPLPSAAAIQTRVRQSLSAESLAEMMKQEKKATKSASSGNRFVRKVATSFRFRKDKIEEKREEGRRDDVAASSATAAATSSIEQIAAFREKMASRSLPQSPHMERKNKIYTTLNNTGEKVSSAFSWLPSRSPKRPHKDKSATYELNSSISSSASTASTATNAQGVIGSDENLDTLCSSNPIPVYVEKCVQFIENNGGFDQEGLYRVPGNQAHLIDVEKKFLQTGEFDVSSVDIPVHVAATALKNFFSCLPTPLIPVDFHQEIKKATADAFDDDDEKSRRLGEIFAQMPANNRNVLKYLTRHLTRVAESPKTAMDLKNLSKVWFPTLFRPAFDSYEALSSGMVAYQQAMETIFVNSDRIF